MQFEQAAKIMANFRSIVDDQYLARSRVGYCKARQFRISGLPAMAQVHRPIVT